MIRLVLCLSLIFLCGCSDRISPDIPRKESKKTGPPEKVALLAPPELQAKFSYTSFAWTNGPVNWDYMNRKERSQALLGSGGGFTRIDYNDDTVRIKEAYYDPQHLKCRWQEELRGGQWVRNGPEVFYQKDGRFEVLFRIDGEPEGPCILFDANGQETSRQIYKDGIPGGDQ